MIEQSSIATIYEITGGDKPPKVTKLAPIDSVSRVVKKSEQVPLTVEVLLGAELPDLVTVYFENPITATMYRSRSGNEGDCINPCILDDRDLRTGIDLQSGETIIFTHQEDHTFVVVTRNG